MNLGDTYFKFKIIQPAGHLKHQTTKLSAFHDDEQLLASRSVDVFSTVNSYRRFMETSIRQRRNMQSQF